MSNHEAVISLCVTVKNRTIVKSPDGEELNLFEKCLESLGRLHGKTKYPFEVVIVDWQSEDVDLEQYMKEKNFGFPYRFITIHKVKSEKHRKEMQGAEEKIKFSRKSFCRGAGLRIAAANARTDHLLFVDADMLFLDGEVIDKSHEYLLEGISHFPICYSIINKEDKGLLKRLKTKKIDPNNEGWFRKEGFGLSAVTKKMYNFVGGHDRVGTWGKEDLSFFERIILNFPTTRKEYRSLVHQWHPHALSWKNNHSVKK